MTQLSPRSRSWLIAALVVVVIGAMAAWILLPPRALSFAGGRTVSVADYKGPSPVGVPAELR